MGFANIDEVLDYAIAREEEAAALYTDLASRVDRPGMREAFLEFAKEEEGHKLHLESVKSGQLTITVDGKQVYTRELAARGNKAMGLLKKVVGKGQESFEAWVEIPPGRHEVTAYVATSEKPSGYHDSVMVDLEKGETQNLKILAGKPNTPLALKKN